MKLPAFIFLKFLLLSSISIASIDFKYQTYRCAVENYTKSQIFMNLSIAGKHKHLEKNSIQMFSDWGDIAFSYTPKGLTDKERRRIVENDRGNLYNKLEKKYGDIVNNHSAILGSLRDCGMREYLYSLKAPGYINFFEGKPIQ